MKLGLGSYACAWAIGVPGYPPPPAPMDAFSLLDRAHHLGLRVVQYADNLPLDALVAEDLDRLVAEAHGRGIELEVGTRGIAPAHLLRYLGIAVKCGSPILRVVVDAAGHEPAPGEIVETLRGVLPEFADAGVTLAIENHDRFPVATLAKIIRTLDTPYVGICLDTVNSFGSLEGPQVVVETLAPFVCNLHVKDFTIRRMDHNLGFLIEGCPAGAGRLDMPWLLDTLARHGRDCNAILELWPAPEATMEETIAKEASWVEESVRNLRRWIKE